MPFDVWDLVFELLVVYRRLRRTGQHGQVALKIVATLPDGTEAEFPLPSITI